MKTTKKANEIRFLELGLRNFQSYGNNLTTISLDFIKPTVISGFNVDASVEGHKDSNGAGKSTMLNAISFVLYDDTTTDIKKDDFINWNNEKNMEVYVIFEKNGVFYKIERFRKFVKKGGDGIKIFANTTGKFSDDDADIARSGIKQANEQIVEILGTPFDVFTRTVLLTSATESFFELPASSAAGKSNQRDILEELFGYTEISVKSEKLKKDISENKKELDRLFELNSQILDEGLRLKSQVEFTEDQFTKWENEHKKEQGRLIDYINFQSEINFDEERKIFEQINKIESKIQEKNLLIKEKELTVNAALKSKQLAGEWELKRATEIRSLTAAIAKTAVIDFDKQIELHTALEEGAKELVSITKLAHECQRAVDTLEQNVKEKKTEVSSLDNNKCPYCKQEFHDVAEKIIELKSAIKVDMHKILELLDGDAVMAVKLETLNNTLDEQNKAVIFPTLRATLTQKNEHETSVKRLAQIEEETNPHSFEEDDSLNIEIESIRQEITLLRAKADKFKCVQKFPSERDLLNSESLLEANKKLLAGIKDKSNPHMEILDKLKKTQLPENKNTEIETLRDDLEHQEFLYKLLTKKESYIRKNLLSKNLPLLNKSLRRHLSKTGLQHKVVFTDDMSADISMLGKKINYANLSKGQRCRIDLAISFAFRDILQTRHGKINLCMLDEFLDNGLSTAGVSMAIKMLKEIAREDKLPMFIISHKEEVASMFDSKVEIELNKKFSNIVRADIPFTSS